MELDKKENKRTEFQIISSDDKLIIESVASYNKTYGTDFKVEKFIYDEVIFAIITVSKFDLKDIFHLGYQFGGFAEYKRNKGEINW